MKNLYYLFILSFILISCEGEESTPNVPSKYNLTTQVTPASAGTVNPSSGTYDEGETITISATASTNYNFKQWSGTGSGTANPLTFKIISNTTITAEFELMDADNDGVTDALDKCPDTPDGSTVDAEGCATTQLDSDGDGVTDDIDKCSETPENTDVDDSGCSYVYLDENGVTLKATESGEFMYQGDLYRAHLGSLKDIVKSEFFRIHGASKIITTFATDMTSAFRYYHDYGYEPKIEFIPELFNDDISSWDVSNVVSMERMFHGCKIFNQDLSYWDVSEVQNMRGMFHGADKFNQPIGNWDVSNVERMGQMFGSSDNVPDNEFNQDISDWDVSKVYEIDGMFIHSVKFNQDISNWDVSNVYEIRDMFRFSQAFNQDLSSWNVSKAYNCSKFRFGAVNYVLPIPNFTLCDPN